MPLPLQLVPPPVLLGLLVQVSVAEGIAVPAAMLGRVFGNLYGAIEVAAGFSYVLGGFLLDLTSPRATFVVAGVGGLLVTLATAVALPRAMKASTTRTATLAERADTDTGAD